MFVQNISIKLSVQICKHYLSFYVRNREKRVCVYVHRAKKYLRVTLWPAIFYLGVILRLYCCRCHTLARSRFLYASLLCQVSVYTLRFCEGNLASLFAGERQEVKVKGTKLR